ncbi:TIGR02391 family protein [Candidatus Woesearchaeota archaeon B3_Woes]|nr:MAG: TIGR02391 family protein [Candidatus Woesearchaeota archaeon B3_Woes]
MNDLQKLKINISSLLDIVNSDKKFFQSIVPFVTNLNNEVNNNPIDLSGLEFLMKKVESFYQRYRSSGNSRVLYISPKQASNSDPIVKEIIEIIDVLKDKEPDDIEKESEEIKQIDSNTLNNESLKLKDQKLYESCKSTFESEDYWNFVFNATRHLEVRIREKARLDATDTGTTLMNKSFHVDNGCLRIPSCKTVAEEEGFFHILRGIVMFHRNAKGHREGEIEKERALQIVNYIDYLIDMIESAERKNK